MRSLAGACCAMLLLALGRSVGAQDRPPPAAVVSTPAAADSGTCDPAWFARVYRSARDAVVRIDSVAGTGAGFLFHSPQHVATAFHVIELGRDVTVTTVDGKRFGAEVVATDAANDLAILQLSEPVRGVVPLEPGASDDVVLGTPVLVIGHPYAPLSNFDRRLKGLLSWSVSQGIISGKSSDLLQTDAAINPGNSGGPLLGCDGRLLGVISAKLQAEGMGFVIPVKRLQKLTTEIGRQGIYRGGWSGYGPLVALSIALNPEDKWVGFSAGLGVVAFDRWAMILRFGYSWEVSGTPESLLSRFRGRMQGELELDHRWVLLASPIPLYFTAGGGGVLARDSFEEKRLKLAQVDPACTAGCAQKIVTVQQGSSGYRAWPMIAIGVDIPNLFTSYSFMLDVQEVQLSMHRFLIGFSF